jgi:aspartyl aminopeptidase
MTHPIVERFLQYLDASVSPLHAVQATIVALEDCGFTEVDATAEPRNLPEGFRGYVRKSGSIVAFCLGSHPLAEAGFRLVAAHTDSPNLRVKPQPLIRSHGYVRLGVEVYGGVTVPTWSDRDLGMAGALTVREGEQTRQVLIDIRRPVCRVPNLAIHLNRKVNDEGLKLNKQTHLPAVLCLDDGESDDPLRALLAAEAGVDPAAILTWDLSLYDLTPATVGGSKDEFIFSARLDNLACCHAGLEGFTRSLDETSSHTSVLALFDHEEIGSHTSRGANSRFIETVLGYLVENTDNAGTGGLSRALSHSVLISADMAHAVHPAFADKHDAQHMPKINAGPVIKQNANYRYTTEGESAAMFVLLCEKAKVDYQWFVNRTDLACGSTVGPMLASRLGVQAVDVGNPMLSMHSVREMCGTADHPALVDVFATFFG